MSEVEALLGRTIAGKFAVVERIGGGAMGEVFRARHTALDITIALKLMRPDFVKDPTFKERFNREASAASRLNHPNTVRVLDFGIEPDGLVYLAMEFLRGRDLLSIVREESPLPDDRVIDILLQTLAAVSVGHDEGIVHRDLKPENIMVTVGPEDDGAKPDIVKVCDFGIANLIDLRGSQNEGDSALAASGPIIGTPEYMSPEQARGDALDARSDLYSLGIVLYQLLVGKVPFSAENARGVLRMQVSDEPARPSTLRPDVNPRLEAICMRALKKSPGERFQTAKEMRRALRSLAVNRPQSMSDESMALLPVAAPISSDSEIGSTLAHSDEQAAPATARKVAAPVAVAKEHLDVSPKKTTAGTEIAVPAAGRAGGSRGHRGTILGVALLVLFAVAAAIVVISERTATPDAQAKDKSDGSGQP